MGKVLIILGTRPEAVKLAPVIWALRRRKIRPRICATAQHRGLLDGTLALLGIRPDDDLDLMESDQRPEDVARRVLHAMGPVFDRVSPSMVVVQGDTTTAASAAFAAFSRGVPVAHVEAGLRSFDLSSPFPEEGNRILIDHLASVLFSPTRRARGNLLREGVSPRRISVTGNTVLDSLAWALERGRRGPEGSISRLARSRVTVLVTLHRRESFGRPLKDIFEGLLRIVRSRPQLRLICPVHPNPSVREPARRFLRHERIRLCRPLPYLEFIRLISLCRFVITDSGGLQEEAAALHKPVLVVRDKTERPELIESGGGRLVGRRPEDLVREAARLLDDESAYRRMCRARNPFGDGHAGDRIAVAIEKRLKQP